MGKIFYSLFISTFIIIFSYADSSAISGTSVQGTATEGIISTQSESSVGGTTTSESSSQSQQTEETKNIETQQEIEKLKEQYMEEIKQEGQGQPVQISDIEISYMSKIGLSKVKRRLRQFGYNFFRGYRITGLTSVGDKYILGPGDFLLLYIWGDPVDILGLKGFYRLVVDREGKVFIPNLGVFYVWGLSVAKAKNLFYDFFKKKFKNFQIELSLGKLRTFPVYVSGFVNKPSVVQVTGINTVLDALALAGGISKNGSLRDIILRRATGEEQKIDLYDLLVKGKPINILVKEGDSIYVGPIGKTAAIYGEVKRPAIYELKENATIDDLIKLAGGLNPSAYEYNVKLYRYENNKLIIKDGSLKDKEFMQTKLKDSDVVKIERILDMVQNSIEIKGYVSYPGIYPVEETKTLKKAIAKAGLFVDTNLYYGEILRIDEKGKYKVIKFRPIDILNGKEDITLQPLDSITFYPNFIFKPIKISGEIKEDKVIPYYSGITLLDVLRNVNFNISPRYLKAIITKNNITPKKIVYLYDLLIKDDKTKNVKLNPGDSILIKEVENTEKDKTVTILGEVNRPGIYKYKSGMRLYDLIVEAGGYTEDAYPKALIFIRESAKKLQQEQLQTSILAMEESIAESSEDLKATGEATSTEEKIITKMYIDKQKRLLSIIKKKAKLGLGRVALDIPNSLEELKYSKDNIQLQDGDFIYIPSKPNYILVLGDVYNQISLPYRKDFTVEDYLKEVGGLKENAKEDDIYIIKANGRVVSRRNFDSSFIKWQDNKLYIKQDFYAMKLEQGDTIVVPTELKIPTMWRPLLRDITQIIFQSISTAVLAKRL